MKKSTLLAVCATVLLFFGSTGSGWGATIFTESMGSVSSTTAIAVHEANNGFDNDAYTMTGTGDVRNNTNSSGYTGASGLANIFITNTNGTYFQIADINTSAYTSLSLSFGCYKSTNASNGSELIIEVSSDGTSYSALTFPAMSTGNGTATWYLRTQSGGTIPSTSNLRIRFRQNGTTPQFRIDDVVLTGTHQVLLLLQHSIQLRERTLQHKA